MFKLLIIVAFVTLVKSHDFIIGTEVGGKKIIDEDHNAGPAIFSRQVQNVTVTADDNEVISKIVVTDMRPEKDGDVRIVEGGTGEKNVTLELKSPTALRGFAFHVEVYSAPEDKVKSTAINPKVEDKTIQKGYKNNEANFNPPITTFKDTSDSEGPKLPHSMSTDTKINDEKKNVDANAENVHRSIFNLPDKTETKATTDQSNNNDNKAFNVEENIHEHRHTRETVKEQEEKSSNTDNYHHESNTGKSTPFFQHPIETSKHGASSEKPEQTSTPKFSIEAVTSTSNDEKRDARDTELKQNNDNAQFTPKTAMQDINKPQTQEIKSPMMSHEVKRQVNAAIERNNNPAMFNNNNDSFIPLRTAKDDSENESSKKERKARDTEENVKDMNSPIIVANAGNKSKLPLTNQQHNSDDKKVMLPSMVDLKQNPQNDEKTTEQYGKSNTAIPRRFRPIPYTSLSTSTTDKSEIKRDTEQKVQDNEKNKEVLKNTPSAFGRQKYNNEAKPVISIQ